MKLPILLCLLLNLSLSLAACNTPAAFLAKRTQNTPAVRANLAVGAGGQVLTIYRPEQLDERLRNARDLSVVLDNSNNTYPVTRQADGAISFALPPSTQPDSDGSLAVLLVADNRFSQMISLQTGPLLQLKSPAISASPAQTVTRGTPLTLQANLAEPEPADFNFNWFYATAVAGPWAPISGNGTRVSWEPPASGNFFIRLDMVNRQSQATSSHISATPLISVRDSDQIVQTIPASGQILQGDKIRLKADIPELQGQPFQFQWAYSQGPQGPFQPIGETGQEVEWEPPAAGSYYLRIRALGDGQTMTYVTTKAPVSVSQNDDVFATSPASGTISRGDSLTLTASVPGTDNQLSYDWSYSPGPQGPFIPISGNLRTQSWQPNQTGEFFLRVRAFNPASGTSKTYTSSKALVSIKDSDARFELSPSPAQILKGQAVNLKLKDSPATHITWSYAAAPQGPFLPIPGTGQAVSWTPPSAGSFFLRAEASSPAGMTSTFTSATALVVVAESANVIRTSPAPANLNLGERLRISAEVPGATSELRYNWSYSTSALGPWAPVEPLGNQASAQSLTWLPTQIGSFFLKADVTNPTTQAIVSYVSPTALVFVKEDTPFFKTNPTPATITKASSVTLETAFQPGNDPFIYAWSYGASTVGPFFAIGGSIQPKITWQGPGVTGTFYIKFDAISSLDNRVISFVSKSPLVFISESNASAPTFGIR